MLGMWKMALNALHIDASSDRDYMEYEHDHLQCGGTETMDLNSQIYRAIWVHDYVKARQCMQMDEWKSLKKGDQVQHCLKMAGGLMNESKLVKESIYFSQACEYLGFVEKSIQEHCIKRGGLKAEALSLRGVAFRVLGDFDMSQKFLGKALKLYELDGNEGEAKNIRELINAFERIRRQQGH